MKTFSQRLQEADIGFIELSGRHMHVHGGRDRIGEIVLTNANDLIRFAAWAAANNVDFDNARIATPEEIEAAEELF